MQSLVSKKNRERFALSIAKKAHTQYIITSIRSITGI